MKISITRLDHVQICIPIGAEAEAREFYTRVLDWPEIEKPDALKPNGGLWLQAGDIQLHIGTETVTEKSKSHPAFEVENFHEVKAYLQQNGVTIKEEIAIPGIERFSILDPFRNRIEFLQHV